jgi:hypothetical protein
MFTDSVAALPHLLTTSSDVVLSRTLSLAGAIAVPPICARHPFAPAPTDITPHRGSCIHAFVVQLLRARRANMQPAASVN